jgi:hypothetical protein
VASHRPPPPDYRTARHDDPRYDRRPPYREAARHPASPRDYRPSGGYDRPAPREASRYAPPRRDYRAPPSGDRYGGPLTSEQRRTLLREYERNARRQFEIERELGGGPPRLPASPRDR